MSKTIEPRWLDMRMVLQYVPGMTHNTIDKFILKGKLPVHKVGKKKMFDRNEVDEMFKNNVVEVPEVQSNG